MSLFGDPLKGEKEMMSRQEQFGREQTAQNIAGNVGVQQDTMSVQYPAEYADFSKWTQDLKDQLEELKMDLRNQVVDESGKIVAKTIRVYNQKEKQYQMVILPPRINEIGIQMIETEIKPYFSRNIINSNLQEERILMMLSRTCAAIRRNLVNRFDEFGMGSNPAPDELSAIMDTIKNCIVAGPYRAMNDGERRHIRTFSKRIETMNEQKPQERKKLLGII